MVKRVVFIQKFVPHYRLPLFESLRDQLKKNNIEFILIYGSPDPYEGSKIKMSYPEWGIKVDSKIFKFFGRYLYWQGAIHKVRKGDIVIAEQAAKLLDNYILYFMQQFGYIKFCYFGHGKNFQNKYEIPISRFIKKLMLKRISCWFSYTNMSTDALLEQGVSVDKIQTVNNTLQKTNTLTEKDVTRIDHKLVYIGGLYNDKRIEFLLESAELIYQSCKGIELHIIGSGPLADLVRSFATTNTWCKYYGSAYGEDRDRLLFSSSAILMPGLVGLVAVDSFHYACPIITTNCGQHSPEYCYLENNTNSLILDDEGNPASYANLVLEFLNDQTLRSSVRQGSRNSADEYTIDDTASNFVKGIMRLSE